MNDELIMHCNCGEDYQTAPNTHGILSQGPGLDNLGKESWSVVKLLSFDHCQKLINLIPLDLKASTYKHLPLCP